MARLVICIVFFDCADVLVHSIIAGSLSFSVVIESIGLTVFRTLSYTVYVK